MKDIFEFFRRFQRQNELHRDILAFSISHDNDLIRIYDQYALINEDDAFVYCYSIKKFDITSEEKKKK